MGSHAITYAVVALAIAAACLFAGFIWGRSNVKDQIEQAVEKEHVALDAREFAMRTQLEDAIAELARLRPQAEELVRVQKRLEREQAKYAQMRAEFNATMGIAPEPSAGVGAEPEPEPAESADEAIQKLLQSLEVFNDPNAPPAAEPVVSSNPAPANAAAPQPAPVPPIAAAAPAAPPAASKPPETPRPAVVSKPAEAARPAVAALPGAPPAPAQPSPAPAPAPMPSPRVVAPAAAASTPAPPQPHKPGPVPPRTSVPNPPSKPVIADSGKPGQHVDEWQEFARQLEALTGKKK